MTLERLGEVITVIDAGAQLRGAASEFTVEDIPVVVIESRALTVCARW